MNVSVIRTIQPNNSAKKLYDSNEAEEDEAHDTEQA
jgi:hypothetical protein